MPTEHGDGLDREQKETKSISLHDGNNDEYSAQSQNKIQSYQDFECKLFRYSLLETWKDNAFQ